MREYKWIHQKQLNFVILTNAYVFVFIPMPNSFRLSSFHTAVHENWNSRTKTITSCFIYIVDCMLHEIIYSMKIDQRMRETNDSWKYIDYLSMKSPLLSIFVVILRQHDVENITSNKTIPHISYGRKLTIDETAIGIG